MPPGAALFTHHAFVDLETTGLDPSTDEVIELGVLFVDAGQVVRRVSHLFRASHPLPLPIRRITGITDEELKDRPAFASYVPELRELLRGWTVVAHNAAFERSFLAELIVDAGVLDSCELLHYLYPELESHSLESVIRWAGAGDKAAHRALKDCEDTFAVACHALDRCVSDGRADDLRELIECLDVPGAPRSPLIELLQKLMVECKNHPPPLTLTMASQFLPGPPGRERTTAPAKFAEQPQPVTDAEVDALLGPGGALERTVEGFASRPEQVTMARSVAKALSEGGALAVEAGTGTGKSLAYLAPAALFAARNGRKVAIAPHTRTLQDQLVEKDLPRLHRATGGAFQYAVLKGQTNYVCRRRALEATRVRESMSYEERAPRAYLRAFLRRSAEGHLDRLSYWFRERFPQLGGLVVASRSEATTTLAERCPHYQRCFYHSAVAQAKAADLLVINQSLAMVWPQRYPRVDEVILDEAHELEDVATGALASELSDLALARVGTRLRTVLAQLRRALPKEPARELLGKVEGQMRMLELASEGLSASLAAFCAAAESSDGSESGFAQERRIDEAARASPEWAQVRKGVLEVADGVEAVAKALGAELSSTFPAFAANEPALDREVAGAVAELQDFKPLLDQLAHAPLKSQCYAAVARADRGDWTLAAQPVDVSPFFLDGFLKEKRSVVLTSATLSLGNEEQPWVLKRLGMLSAEGRPPPAFLRARSPFDLKRQALVVLVTDAPRPQDEAFIDWAAQRIAGLARFMGGRVLGLFASSRRLERVGEKVRAQLEPLGIEVMRQSRGSGRVLAARQERDFGSVLLGTKSFWQGVDIPGLGVGLVFIDKLPIEPQSRPIVSAREERWASADGSGFAGFSQYRLPRALLMLRQGVGRLVRSTRDRGVVVIADPGNPRYRAQVLAALDGYRVEELPWQQARVSIFNALVSMGLNAQVPPAAAPRVDPQAVSL